MLASRSLSYIDHLHKEFSSRFVLVDKLQINGLRYLIYDFYAQFS